MKIHNKWSIFDLRRDCLRNALKELLWSTNCQEGSRQFREFLHNIDSRITSGISRQFLDQFRHTLQIAISLDQYHIDVPLLELLRIAGLLHAPRAAILVRY